MSLNDDAARECARVAHRIGKLGLELAQIDQCVLESPDADRGKVEREASASAVAAVWSALHDFEIKSDALMRTFLVIEMIIQGRTGLAFLTPDRSRQRPKTTERVEDMKAKIAAVAYARGGVDGQKLKNAKLISRLLRGSAISYAITGRSTVAPRTILDWVSHFADAKPSTGPVSCFADFVSAIQAIEKKQAGKEVPEDGIKAMFDKIATPLPSRK